MSTNTFENLINQAVEDARSFKGWDFSHITDSRRMVDAPTKWNFINKVQAYLEGIDTLLDMEKLFDGIPLDKVTVSMTINATACVILAMYIACAKKRKIPLKKLGGTIQNDILKEYVARGTYIFPYLLSHNSAQNSLRSWRPVS